MPEGQEKPPKDGTIFFFFFFWPDRVLKTARKSIPGGGNSRYEGLEVTANRGV